MVFSSVIFLFYFLPLFLILYYLSPEKIKNVIVLIFSVLFYAWGAPKFIFLVLASMTANYYLVDAMHRTNQRKSKKILLIFSLFINVGILAYFKYFNFFIDNLNSILEISGANKIHWTNVALPVGISFFTFQSITYSVDVYRNIHKPLHKLSDYLVYILMFPQLIAGPIIRFNSIADQIINRKNNETLLNRILGFQRFCIGLAKKALIANSVGEGVDALYSIPPDEISTLAAWMASLGYAMQIYFDFSGYSDMAIGIGRMIGFTFPENFNNPYRSRSITEFWRRWHITLGRWMKDYLYIPLGGNRVTPAKLYLNLWIVFLISGLWHGASWNFIIWGAFHGLFLILDRLFLLKILDKSGKSISIAFTFFVTLVGWVFFRVEELRSAVTYIKQMFSFSGNSFNLTNKNEFLFSLGIAVIFSFITLFKLGEKAEHYFYYKSDYKSGQLLSNILMSVILLTLSASYIVSSGFNPFIYFRF